MKKFLVVAVAILAASWLSELQAAKQRLPVSFSGSVLTSSGKVSVGDAYLLQGNTNRLVIVIDLDAQTIELEEWDPTLTTRIDRQPPYELEGTNVIYASYRAGILVDSAGKKAVIQSDLEQVDLDWDNNSIEDASGDLQLAAKVSLLTGVVTKVSGKLQGVVNDSVNGATNNATILLPKGKIKSTGPVF